MVSASVLNVVSYLTVVNNFDLPSSVHCRGSDSVFDNVCILDDFPGETGPPEEAVSATPNRDGKVLSGRDLQ